MAYKKYSKFESLNEAKITIADAKKQREDLNKKLSGFKDELKVIKHKVKQNNLGDKLDSRVGSSVDGPIMSFVKDWKEFKFDETDVASRNASIASRLKHFKSQADKIESGFKAIGKVIEDAIKKEERAREKNPNKFESYDFKSNVRKYLGLSEGSRKSAR